MWSVGMWESVWGKVRVGDQWVCVGLVSVWMHQWHRTQARQVDMSFTQRQAAELGARQGVSGGGCEELGMSSVAAGQGTAG